MLLKYLAKLILQRLEIVMLKWGFLQNNSRHVQMLLKSYFEEMNTEKGPVDFKEIGFNVYSYTYEDGIFLYIFSQIGMTNKKIVDIGAGTFRGSSGANLIINHGFTGLLIEGNHENVKLLQDYYSNHPETRYDPPTVIEALVTRENINQILEEHQYQGDVDLLCIDIDGMDYWIWQAIDVIQPRVVVIEYQDILGPELSWTVPYSPDFNVQHYEVNKTSNNYCGASLRAFAKLGQQKKYRLVGCNRGGWNAFFVKSDLGRDVLHTVDVESCFKSAWNKKGMATFFPLVKALPWDEV